MNFFKDGLSVDETKVSVVMFAFLFTVGVALWQAVKMGDISGGMLTLLAYEIGAITGMNVVNSLGSIGKKKQEDFT